ncbi:MAG: ABC transporter ATP-binding protein [Elusimicrobia bacterium]|nr:ABC transporter ATP-binding protein [Elusimicrobiota bacterium]
MGTRTPRSTRILSSIVCGALLLTCPGPNVYEAAAQVISVQVNAPVSGAPIGAGLVGTSFHGTLDTRQTGLTGPLTAPFNGPITGVVLPLPFAPAASGQEAAAQPVAKAALAAPTPVEAAQTHAVEGIRAAIAVSAHVAAVAAAPAGDFQSALAEAPESGAMAQAEAITARPGRLAASASRVRTGVLGTLKHLFSSRTDHDALSGTSGSAVSGAAEARRPIGSGLSSRDHKGLLEAPSATDVPSPSTGGQSARGRLAAGLRALRRTVVEMLFGEAEFASLTRPYRGQMILARLILAFQAVMGTALGYATGAFVDAALAHAAPLALGWFLGMAALTVARILVSRHQWVMLERVKVNIRQDLRMAFFEHVQRLPASFGRRGDPPEITMRLLNDVGRVMTKNVDIPVNTPMLVIQLVMAAGFVLHTSLPLAAGILVSLPLLAYLSARFSKKMEGQQSRLAAIQADLTRLGQDLFSANRDARASGGDAHAASVYRSRSGVYEALLLEIAKLSSDYCALRDFLQTAFSEFLILGAGFLSFILTGSPSVGQITSLRAYAGDLRGAFSGLLDRYNDGRSADGGLSRLHELRRAVAAAPDKPGAQDFAGSEVSFRALSYTLPEQGEVLRGADFSAAPGERVLVVGGEAAARRSLIDLLLRLDSPTSGSVRAGGADVTGLKRDSLIASVSLVAADAAAFSGTLRENLLFGIARRVTDEELTAALRTAGAACLLDPESLPQGLDTLIEDKSGTVLDAEQRQRLALARAVLKGPAVLIGEDLGQGLDPGVARAFRRDFGRLSRGRTTLVFAGQPERGEEYDRIVVLHDGAVVESGTHSQLMALGGRYMEMVEASSPGMPPTR